MGLLKSVLSLGGAAIGNAIAPGIGGKIGAALGGAAGGALSSSRGSSKATAAQLAAIQEARGIAGQAKTEAIGYQQPYMDFGQGSVNALSGRLGVSMPQRQPATAGANALTMGGGGAPGVPGMSAPYTSNAERRAADGVGGGVGIPPGGYGGDVSRAAGPMNWTPTGEGVSADAKAAMAAANPADPSRAIRTDVSRAAAAPIDMAQQPDGTYAMPPASGVDPGTFGDTSNPTAPTPYQRPEYQTPEGPAPYQFDLQKSLDSPVLQAALKRGMDVTQSAAAAQGSLYSGATLKDLSNNALRTTYDFLDKERNFAYGQSRDARSDYQDNRNFGRDVYTGDRGFDYGQSRDARSDYQVDRGYLTDRFDTQTNNLFRGVGVGQGAANTASNAATKYGDQVVGLVTDAGNAKAQNALTQGQIGADFATGAGGIIAGAIGGGAPKNALTMGGNNVQFVNTPASISRNISYFKG